MLKGYKTLIFNIAAAILGVLGATNTVDIGLTGNGAMYFGAAIAGLNMVLRFFTTTPVATGNTTTPTT